MAQGPRRAAEDDDREDKILGLEPWALCLAPLITFSIPHLHVSVICLLSFENTL